MNETKQFYKFKYKEDYLKCIINMLREKLNKDFNCEKEKNPYTYLLINKHIDYLTKNYSKIASKYTWNQLECIHPVLEFENDIARLERLVYFLIA